MKTEAKLEKKPSWNPHLDKTFANFFCIEGCGGVADFSWYNSVFVDPSIWKEKPSKTLFSACQAQQHKPGVLFLRLLVGGVNFHLLDLEGSFLQQPSNFLQASYTGEPSNAKLSIFASEAGQIGSKVLFVLSVLIFHLSMHPKLFACPCLRRAWYMYDSCWLRTRSTFQCW